MGNTGFKPIISIMDRYDLEETKQRRISREFQDYAYRLAVELGDTAHTAIYMRLAKNTPRPEIEQARLFVLGANNPTSKARLFMWKLKQIRDEKKNEEK
ncbi:MAG TPA: hypothetical protein PLI45_04140 [Candidatus Woesebacteria bacterium]|nr:hypothetical protein [Candidatus Woesebacteria bacterium]